LFVRHRKKVDVIKPASYLRLFTFTKTFTFQQGFRKQQTALQATLTHKYVSTKLYDIDEKEKHLL